MSERLGDRVMISLRLDVGLRDQLNAVARLRGSSVTQEIHDAVAAHLLAAGRDPALTDKARRALDDIEREAQAQKDAITTWLGQS